MNQRNVFKNNVATTNFMTKIIGLESQNDSNLVFLKNKKGVMHKRK